MAQKFNPISGQFDTVLDKAEEIKYSNSSSGLVADDVQGAIDEVKAEIDALPDPITYQGTWNASTNTPTLANSDTNVTGHLYQVSAAGSVDFGAGSISFEIGDKVVNNGTVWEKWDMTDAVTSVNGQTGVAVLDSDDVSEGSSNLYFSDARAQAAIVGGASSITTANLTTGRALASDGSGKVAVSATTATELGYVAGVTSAIQTQIDGKQATVTGAATSIVSSDLTADRALTSDGSGKVAVSSATATELGYLSGVTSGIQAQLDTKSGDNGTTKNYVTNYGAETDVSGWAAYADVAGTAPVDGTGGSPTSTWTRTTSSPLRGTGSFLLTKDAANRQGEGASYDFTIDAADKGRVLTINFDYEVASGTYATGDVTVWVYDVTNSRLIQPSAYEVESTGVPAQAQPLEFQASIDSTSYRLIFHVSTTSASAYTLKFDNITVGPQSSSVGTIITDWQAYTPIFTNFTASASSFFWRRFGDTMQIQGRATVSSVSGTMQVSIPSGRTIDTNKIPATNNFVGNAMAEDVGVGFFSGNAETASSTVIQFNGDDGGGRFNTTFPMTWVSGDFLSINVTVPIQGWGSNTVMSDSAATREVMFMASQTSNQTGINPNGSAVKMQFGNVIEDSTGGFSTANNRYVVSVPGTYVFSTVLNIGAANTLNNSYYPVLYKNGSELYYGGRIIPAASTAFSVSSTFPQAQAVAGDYFEIFLYGQGNNSASTLTSVGSATPFTFFGGHRLASPQQIAASETVYAHYTRTTSLAIGTGATDVIFATKVDDTHSAYNSTTGVFTAPRPGIYTFTVNMSGTVNLSTSQRWYAQINFPSGTDKNIGRALGTGASVTHEINGAVTIKMNAGDTAKVVSASNVGFNLGGSASLDWISILSKGG